MVMVKYFTKMETILLDNSNRVRKMVKELLGERKKSLREHGEITSLNSNKRENINDILDMG